MILYSLEELNDGAIIVCPECGGWGKDLIETYESGQTGVNFKEKECDDCDGKGRVKIRHEKIKE